MISNPNAVYQLVVRNLKCSWRTPLLLAVSLFQPIVWLALFSQSFRQVVNFPQFNELGYASYMSFFVPGNLALTVLNTSIRSGIAMVTDVNTGVLDKFLISPINRTSILLGRVLADSITMAVQCVTILVIALALGVRPKTGFVGMGALLVIALALGICAAAFSNYIALRTRNPQVTMVVGINSTLPLMFLSPAFFPLQLQPGWLQGVTKINPVAYAVTSGQDLLNIGVNWGQLLATTVVLGLTALITVTAATRAFHQATSGSGRVRTRRPKKPTVPVSAATPTLEEQPVPSR